MSTYGLLKPNLERTLDVAFQNTFEVDALKSLDTSFALDVSWAMTRITEDKLVEVLEECLRRCRFAESERLHKFT